MITEMAKVVLEEDEKLVESFLKKYYKLDPDEISSYIALLKKPSTLSSLSMRINVDKTKTYRTGNKLINLGLIESKSGNPKIYYAKEPKIALQLYLNTKLDELKAMQSQIDIVEKHLVANYTKIEVNSPTFVILQGMFSINMNVINLIRKSKKEVKLIMDFNELKKEYFTQLPEVIRESKSNIRIITNPTNKVEEKFLKNFMNCKISFVDECSLPRMLITENRVMLGIAEENLRYQTNVEEFRNDPSTCFLTNSPSIIQISTITFEYMWDKGKK